MSRKAVHTLTGRTIRCILFDLGGTLWRQTDKETIYALEQAANEKAVAILYEHLPPTFHSPKNTLALGHHLREAIDEETHSHAYLISGYEPDFALATIEALLELGFPRVNRTVAGAIFAALRLRSCESRVLFPDVLPTLAELRARGFLLGVVTNRQHGGQLFYEDLQKVGLLDYFDYRHMAISADLGARKPNPEIFQFALDGLGVAPEEAAMVGDSLRADVGGANLLNIYAIWKPKPRLRSRAQADLLLEHGEDEVPQKKQAGKKQATRGKPPNFDDDYLLVYAKKHDRRWEPQRHDSIKPDLIIEDTSDLLDIFQQPGLQS